MEKAELRKLIIRSLKNQGFRIEKNRIELPIRIDKDGLRSLHSSAVRHRIEIAEPSLRRKEAQLLEKIACGNEIDPHRINPKLVEVKPGSQEELLFRYAGLHWAIPVSSGYGRRLRFLVVDQHNEKLIGIIGLGDPVYGLGPRDKWIGWDRATHRDMLHHVMDAFVLGAVPPYSLLLAGKLVAMLLSSSQIRLAFKGKYGGRESLIRTKKLDARLSLVTTMSALGRSSVYNRLKYNNRLMMQSVGFTRGSGEFHFSNGLYRPIADYAAANCEPTYKQENWGGGFRSKREVIKKCLSDIGLPSSWLYHGIGREVFVMPLAANTRDFLSGKQTRLRWYHDQTEELAAYCKARWIVPRSNSDHSYKSWDREKWRLWQK